MAETGRRVEVVWAEPGGLRGRLFLDQFPFNIRNHVARRDGRLTFPHQGPVQVLPDNTSELDTVPTSPSAILKAEAHRAERLE